ncbi:hypothetical protein [Saccharicrinis aurantiacus]|uniref:hypothetical protein n=1 Tax=Saccharicrinis aurantiacus TaxID=1849719 RepID=UPI00095003D9|nr:hypothetical protein [Saccharicrinis aurantiacus]
MKNAFYTTTIILAFIIGIFNQDINAQEQNATPAKIVKSGLEGQELNLKEQFDFVITKSESYQSYKVVKTSSLNKLKVNSLDSIQIYKDQIKDLEVINDNHIKEINKLKENLSETNEKLTLVSNEKDSFSFMGFLMLKGTYSTMMWLIVLVLIIAIAVLVFLFKRSNYVTTKTKESLNDKQDELDKHRKWALEREQNLARELNKLKQKYKGFE